MKIACVELGVSFCLFLLGLFSPVSEIRPLFILGSYLFVGLGVLKEAVQNLFKGKIFDENFLMTVATIGAFCIGEYPEAAAIMLFYRLGEFFQDLAVSKSKNSIKALMELKPDKAFLLEDGKMKEVSPLQVQVGDIIVIKPGEKVPLDGKIIEGNTYLNTVNLTGESIPLEVSKGDTVLSGVEP